MLPRPVLIAGAVVLLLALTWGAWWAFDRSREDQVAFGTTGYRVTSDSSVRVSFEVRKADDRAASCRVEALDRDGRTVGSAVVRVGAGTRATSHDLATSARAATALVTGCALEPSPTPAGP